VADDGAGNHAEACLAEALVRPARHLQRHLVIAIDRVLAGCAAIHRERHDAVVIEAEGQKHRLLQPLVHGPAVLARLARQLLGHAHRAIVEAVQRLVHGVPHLALCRTADFGAVVPRLFDGGGE
jgi:hypothetical protein